MIDWIGAVLAILKAVRPEERKIDPKYIAIKPRILSDDNILRGVAALRAVLMFIPQTAIAGPILSLGETGFKIWKRIALNKEWDELVFPPMDPNSMRIGIEIDTVLKSHFGDLTREQNWTPKNISDLEIIYNDFSFITDATLLQAKYPQIEAEYIAARCAKNKEVLQQSLDSVVQELRKVRQRPEVDANLTGALGALESLFPAMRDWALFSSEGFKTVVDVIDTIV